MNRGGSDERGSIPLLIATRNAGKLEELRAMFASLGRTVIDLAAARVPHSDAEDELEVYPTFEENALAKARYYHEHSNGRPTVADDSGLEVHALGGAPGVHSRRWGGTVGSNAAVTAANNAHLLERLRQQHDRSARFVCVVAYVDAERILTRRGTVVGRIATAARGSQGFGYDPLFEADDLDGRTFAEATALEKRSVSHRARAFEALIAALSGPRPPADRPAR